MLDQYLQIAQLAVAPDSVRVELRLVPGVEVADRVFALIDTDGDGQISPAEEKVYAQRVLQDLSLDIDGRRTPLMLTKAQFPARQEMSQGIGTIRFDLAAKATLDAGGDHMLIFRNDHLPEIGTYLANTLIPETETLEISGQQRDQLQHELKVNFRVAAAENPLRFYWMAGLSPVIFLALLVWKRRYFFRRR